MPKIVIRDNKGITQKPGNGVTIESGAITMFSDFINGGALYSANETVTAAATNGTQLDSAMVQTATAGAHDHRIQMPLAEGAGQIMFIRNVGATFRIDIRNNANDADVLNPLQAGKTALCYSTAAGDNWVGKQLD